MIELDAFTTCRIGLHCVSESSTYDTSYRECIIIHAQRSPVPQIQSNIRNRGGDIATELGRGIRIRIQIPNRATGLLGIGILERHPSRGNVIDWQRTDQDIRDDGFISRSHVKSDMGPSVWCTGVAIDVWQDVSLIGDVEFDEKERVVPFSGFGRVGEVQAAVQEEPSGDIGGLDVC